MTKHQQVIQNILIAQLFQNYAHSNVIMVINMIHQQTHVKKKHEQVNVHEAYLEVQFLSNEVLQDDYQKILDTNCTNL
jgi:hypothetical protein